MNRYVAGLMFSEAMGAVLLIRKRKPEWQAGRLNAIGGKIEPGETPLEAMRREFREEAGLDVANWKRLCTLNCGNRSWIVHFFYVIADTTTLLSARTMTDEEVVFCHSNYQRKMLPNLQWLIPMAKSLERGGEKANCFDITENDFHSYYLQQPRHENS